MLPHFGSRDVVGHVTLTPAVVGSYRWPIDTNELDFSFSDPKLLWKVSSNYIQNCDRRSERNTHTTHTYRLYWL